MATTTQMNAVEHYPAVNQNRASAGFSDWVLLGILGTLSDPDYYVYTGTNTPGTSTIGHRRNDLRVAHAAAIERAAITLRHAGIRVRLFHCEGRAHHVVVYGPKTGGQPGRYSA